MPPRRPGRALRTLLLVAGETLITLGAVVLLLMAWELWGTNLAADSAQRKAVGEFAASLGTSASPQIDPANGYGPTPVTPKPERTGEVFGVAYVPRFGPEYARPLVEGTAPAQLDTLGLGHYPRTTMPGAPGNFALAGHRQTHGAVLDSIDTLVPGDRIYVQTRSGYYVYKVRGSEIVAPDRVDVLLPVPKKPGTSPSESVLTLTSCNPRYGDWERFIVYSALDSWRPIDAGAPTEIAAQVARTMGK